MGKIGDCEEDGEFSWWTTKMKMRKIVLLTESVGLDGNFVKLLLDYVVPIFCFTSPYLIEFILELVLHFTPSIY